MSIEETYRRTTWDETWGLVTENIAMRSRCVIRAVGAVIVSADNGYTVVGYNGPPAGLPIEDDETCLAFCSRARDRMAGRSSDYKDCIAVHAELNALLKADRSRIAGGTIYVTTAPCLQCAKAIANSGLARAVFPRTEARPHRNPTESVRLLKSCGLEVEEKNK